MNGWAIKTLRRYYDELEKQSSLIEVMPSCTVIPGRQNSDGGEDKDNIIPNPTPGWVPLLKEVDSELYDFVNYKANINSLELREELATAVSKKFEREREGDVWSSTHVGSETFSHVLDGADGRGNFFNSFVVDSPLYLEQLEKAFVENSGNNRIHNVHLKSRQEAEEYAKSHGCKYVINCAGNGSGLFCKTDSTRQDEAIEDSVTPARGILAVYKRDRTNPKHNIKVTNLTSNLPPCYIIPRNDIVVCGGSCEPNNLSQTISAEEKERLKGNWSSLTDSVSDDPIDYIMGWRPVGKEGVRCEIEENNDSSDVSWSHNFGHGGAGWTLCWGCAEELVDRLMNGENELRSFFETSRL